MQLENLTTFKSYLLFFRTAWQVGYHTLGDRFKITCFLIEKEEESKARGKDE